jgi:ESCRT-I complex subunit VPS37
MDNSITSLLQHLNKDELTDLLNDEGSKIDDMVKESAQIKALESEREMLIASNKSLAEYNLSREPAYRENRQMLMESHKQALELKDEVEKKRDKLNEVSRQTSLDTTLALIQTAAAEAEEESETFAEKFLSGDLPLESFLSDFIEKRKIAHLRRIKTEKLMEYVRTQARPGYNQEQPSPLRPAPPVPSAMPPYPIAHNMPQPSYGQPNFPFSQTPYR